MSRSITELAITGKPAQFGRGVMQDVSDKLLGQFVACLEARLTDPSESASDALEEPPDGAVPAAEPTRASITPPPMTRTPPREPEAIDLGSAVLPVLAKTYWKQAVGALAAIVVVWWLVKR